MRHASIELQDDHDIVMAAIQSNGAALFHASGRLRANEQIVLAAVQSDGLSLEAAGHGCRTNPTIALAAAKQNGLASKMFRWSKASTAGGYGHQLLRAAF